MREIQLSQGFVAIVDDEDYADLSKFKWYVDKRSHIAYAKRNDRKNHTTELMHRRIMGARLDEDVDHRNHDGLDCQRANLRICSRSQNNANRNKSLSTSSQFKGVCWHRKNKNWVAYIKNRRKRISLGSFSAEIEAARAYDSAARKYFGEFARTNF